jgi:hypothetical protein
MRSKNPIDKISDQLKLFEIRYANKIAEVINATTNSVDRVKNKGKGEEKEKEEWIEVEADDTDMHAEKGRAWQKYLADHGIVIDYSDRRNNEKSETIFALVREFEREWNQCEHPRPIIRFKKPTKEEVEAWRKERKRIAEYRDAEGRDAFGFKD